MRVVCVLRVYGIGGYPMLVISVWYNLLAEIVLDVNCIGTDDRLRGEIRYF
jgi:hypothetical protein